MSEEQWGPWIEHDGMGCPCEGRVVEIVQRDRGFRSAFIAGEQFDGSEWIDGSSWHWAVIPRDLSGVPWDQILKYRIRKPKGLTILENLIADIPQPASPKVDA